MIVAGYSMHLYCENHENCSSFRGTFQEIGGDNYADCARQAKRTGWRLTADKQKAYCPICEAARKDIDAAYERGRKDGGK